MPINWWIARARARAIAGQVAAAVPRRGPNLPIIYVPGILGVKLHDRTSGVDIWGAPGPILRPDPRHKSYAVDDSDDVVATETLHHFAIVPGVIESLVTAELVATLGAALGYREGHDLIFLAHDWRRDYRRVAERLELELARLRHDFGPRTRVVIIGQSVANLAIRQMVRRATTTTRAMIARWYAFGPPWRGTYNSLKMLREGYYPAGRRFRGFTPAEAATFAPCYQLLPAAGRLLDDDGRAVAGFDLYRAECWREHGLGDPGLRRADAATLAALQTRLDDARAFAAEVDGVDASEQAVSQLWFAGDRNHAVTAAVAAADGARVDEASLRAHHPTLAAQTLAVGDDHIPLAHLTAAPPGPIVRSYDALPYGESCLVIGQPKDHRALINYPANLRALAIDLAVTGRDA